MKKALILFTHLIFVVGFSQEKAPFTYMDVFGLEWVSDPQISPRGDKIVYRRMGMSLMKDQQVGSLWIIGTDGTTHQKLTSYDGNESSPRWSSDGSRIAYIRATDQGTEIYVHWLQTGRSARISQLEKSPRGLSWSPDGKQIVFSMVVPEKPPVIVQTLGKPKGAKWAEAPRITDRMRHEADGSGYIAPGYRHIFIIPSEGGSPIQLSSGNYHHQEPSWSPDGKSIVCTGNRSDDWQHDFRNTEVYKIMVADGTLSALTKRNGPDRQPLVSPSGNDIAYLGYEDKMQTYQLTKIHLMDKDGGRKRILLNGFDRSITSIRWHPDGKGLYYSYENEGRTKIGYTDLNGNDRVIADNMGGTTIGRPYGGGSFSVAAKDKVVYNYTRPEHPGELALVTRGKFKQLTHLNADLLDRRTLGKVEAFWWKSTHDQRNIQGWVVKPPQFDPSKKYPLIIENHGGPIANYGERFSPEIQLYAAAGYVVFYPNPRGSTGYGEEFGNLLYHNYPGNDYDDIMSGLDELIARGYIANENVFVTGGSAGGIMTAWMIGKSDRFRASAVVKPVMNWYSKTLVADNWYGYYHSRYDGLPWTNMEHYMKFSPISLVGNVSCPTMVMVGMEDLRTPTSEAKQLYHALKYRKIETVLVEIPGAYHNISKRPSQLATKVAHIVAWFDKYQK